VRFREVEAGPLRYDVFFDGIRTDATTTVEFR